MKLNKDKLKHKLHDLLINNIDIIECVLLYLIIGKKVIGLIITLVYLFIVLRRHFRVWKGKVLIKNKLANERVQGNEGGQGKGKTSLMGYMAKVGGYKANEIYSIVPCKLDGEFTNVLTKNVLALKESLPKHSLILGDELTMFYNNMSNKQEQVEQMIESTEIMYQSIRHFTDGNIINTSVDMTRLNKRLEEKHTIFNQLQGQRTCRSSYIIIPIYKIILKLTKKYQKDKHKYLGTYRIWSIQTFKPITHENYYYDLSNDKLKPNDDQQFSNLFEIWAYNNLDFEYNDTYLERLYQTLPEHVPVKWESLNLTRDTLDLMGQSNLKKYFPKFN